MDKVHNTTRRSFLKSLPSAGAALALSTGAVAAAVPIAPEAGAAADLQALASEFKERAMGLDPTVTGAWICTMASHDGGRVAGVYLERADAPMIRNRATSKLAPSRMELAIKAHRKAWAAFEASCPYADEMDPRFCPEGVARWERLNRAEERKFMALLSIVGGGADARLRAEYLLTLVKGDLSSLERRHLIALLRSTAGYLGPGAL